MTKRETSLAGVWLLDPEVFADDRGFFLESHNERTFAEIGIPERFVQDNHSYSNGNVVRGLHYQVGPPQGKLVRVVTGEILDVALDLRRSSPTFGKWQSFILSGENKRMLWIPPGCAHGFRVIEAANVLYKATGFFAPDQERTVAWNDSNLKIDWQMEGQPLVSAKDQHGKSFNDAEKFE